MPNFDFSVARSMQRQPVHGLAPLRVPYQHGIGAGYVSVRGVCEGLVRQIHGVGKKLFMVHAGIIGRAVRGVHAYFPMAGNAKNFASPGTGNYRKLSCR